MPTSEKLEKISLDVVSKWLNELLQHTRELGVPYVIITVYELAVILYTSRVRSTGSVVDREFKRAFEDDNSILFKARNFMCHQSYNYSSVHDSVIEIIDSRFIESVYVDLFGECPDYEIFEMECYRFLDILKAIHPSARR